jgi:4-hydroxy-2-oxoheptanedioate aldolase
MQDSSISILRRQRWPASRRWAALVVCSVVALWIIAGPQLDAQEARTRANRMIEALEAGRPAITGETWVWVEQEHRPYDAVNLRATIEKLLARKNASGQPELAPIVRIPAEGDQNVRWLIKQTLESGAMGIIVPHVDNADQALRIVQSMRYPQRKDSKYPNPRGRRGCGCSGGAGWGLKNPADYMMVADVWPLNPRGELFAMPMIESPEGVKNVNSILDVPGVSGVLVGPSDLTLNYGEGSWNNPKDSKPDATAAIETVAKACVAKKKTCGMVTGNDEATKKYLDMGYRLMYASYRPNASS